MHGITHAVHVNDMHETKIQLLPTTTVVSCQNVTASLDLVHAATLNTRVLVCSASLGDHHVLAGMCWGGAALLVTCLAPCLYSMATSLVLGPEPHRIQPCMVAKLPSRLHQLTCQLPQKTPQKTVEGPSPLRSISEATRYTAPHIAPAHTSAVVRTPVMTNGETITSSAWAGHGVVH